METDRSTSATAVGHARDPVIGLRQMRYFVALAEERHFGHAAERLRIAQSGLSQQIRKLEHALGTDLFTRGSRRVELTEGGEALLPHARLVLEVAARAEQSVRLVAEGRSGVLRLATAALGYLPEAAAALDEFRDRFPQVQIELQYGLAPQNRDAVRRRAADLAFVTLPLEDETSAEATRYLRLGAIELMMIVPEGHPLATTDRIPRARLLEEEVVTWARPLYPALVDHIHRSLFGTPSPRRVVEVGDTSQLSRIAEITRRRSLIAIGFAPEAELRAPGVVYRPLEAPTPMIEYGIVWPDEYASPFVDTFVEVAREVAGAAT